jgi:hypothetical protein
MSAKEYSNIPVLAKDNYLSWRRLINGYFLTINAAALVQGTETRPGTGSNLDTAREDWDKRNRQAAGAIQLTIDETNAIHTTGIESDAPAQWTKLEELHNNKTAGTRFNAMDTLFSIRMDSGEDLRSLITRVVAAMQRVKALRPGVPTTQPTVYPDPSSYTLETLDNELIIMTLIRALPQDYQHVRVALLIQQKLTLDTVRDAFLAEDNQRQHTTQEAVPALKTFTRHTPPANHSTASAPKPRESFPTTPGAMCTYCGIANHTAEQCRKRIRNQRHAEKHYARANATVTSEIPMQSNVNQPSANEPTAFAANASTSSIRFPDHDGR